MNDLFLGYCQLFFGKSKKKVTIVKFAFGSLNFVMLLNQSQSLLKC